MRKITWIVALIFIFSGIAIAGPRERLFRAHDADSLIDLDESDVAVIELESQPSSGRTWYPGKSLGRHVRIIAREFESDNPGMLGATGVEKIYIVGKAKGRSDLKFEYRRSYEKSAQRSVRFRFNAKAKFKDDLLGVYKAVDTEPMETKYESQSTLSDPLLGLPSSYNWCTANGGCTPIKNQGQCGGCWSFATQGPLENWIKAKDGVTVDLSEQYLISCNDEGWGCSKGGYWAHDYNLNKKVSGETEAGAPLESTMPFQGKDTSCNNKPHAKAYKISSWGWASGRPYASATRDQIKQAIYDHGPVTTAVCANSSFSSYSGGVFTGGWFGCYTVNHGVLLVGWDDNSSCWILRNSWGPEWGESGYMRIGYGVSQVGTDVTYVVYPGGQSGSSSSSSSNSSSSSSGGTSGCQEYTATNSSHVSAGRAYTQTVSDGCGSTTYYYAVGSNANLGTSGSTTTTLYTQNGGQTYYVGSCSGSSSNSSSSTSSSTSGSSSSSSSSSSGGCDGDITPTPTPDPGGDSGEANVTTTFQAENASIVSGIVESEHTGYTGFGYANTDNAAGNYLEFVVTTTQAASYQLTFRYAVDSGNRYGSIQVNGSTVVSNIDFNGTGTWTNWVNASANVNLIYGTNTIRLVAQQSGGLPNVDKMDVYGYAVTGN